jgi:hypothetical protein
MKSFVGAIPLLGIPMLLLVLSMQSFGQAVYGSIFGTVTDSSGAVVQNAKVTVTDESKGTSATYVTNLSGNFSVINLLPDTYDVKVEAPGFGPAESQHVQVAADTGVRIDLTIKPGSQTQTVQVTTEAPQLTTDRSDVAVVFNQEAVEDLPIFNRNFTQFELLSPGTVLQTDYFTSTTENPQGSQQIFVNGQTFGGTSWQLDGTDNRDPVLGDIIINPNLDAVAEMKITNQNFDAEFGNAISGVITAQTKSGNNAFHGSAFEFRRSGDQLARNPFTQFAPDPATGRYIPPTLWNQFGGSLGGPILKNKLFFFGDDQSTRQKAGTTVQAAVPTELARTTCLAATGFCNLSEYLGGGQNQIYDPASGGPNGVGRTPFADNMIPANRLSVQAVTLLGLLPAPTGPGITNNYIAAGTGGYNVDQFDLRLDGQISERLHSFARYTFFNSHLDGTPAFGVLGGPGFGYGDYSGHDFSRDHSVAAGLDYALNSSLLTDFRVGWFQYYVHNLKYDEGIDEATQLGLPGLNTTAYEDTTGMPTINVAGLQSFGDNVANCNCPLTEMEHQFQLVDNWTKTLGNHSIRFGGDIRLAQNLRSASDENRAGVLNFTQLGTALGTGGGGLGLGTFLLGDVTTFNRYVVTNSHAGEHQKRIFFFAQDTWRVTSKLTLNYGLRWEDIFPETVTVSGDGGLVNLADGFLHVAGIGGVPTNGGQQNNLKNFAPRLGLAYSPNQRMVFRLGYGRSFDEGVYGSIFGTALTHNIPVIADQTLQGASSYDAAFSLGVGPIPYVQPVIPADGLIPLQNNVSYPSARPSQMELPTVDMYNLSFQQQVTPSTSFQIAYVGNRGAHVSPGDSAGYNANEPEIGPGPQPERRPLFNRYVNGTSVCCNTDLTSEALVATNTYNSLQARLDKRFSRGLQLGVYYTWERAMGYLDDYFDIDPRTNYGVNDFNRDNDFTSNALYELPVGKGKEFGGNSSTWLNEIIGDWQVNNVTTWAGGVPFTPGYQECTADEDVDALGGALCRPNLIGSSFPYNKGSFNPAGESVQYFVPVAPMPLNGSTSGPFQRPQQYTVGNIGRNSAIGPRLFTSDMSAFKTFKIRERVNAQFRFEAFNVFNHPALGQPNTCVDCTTGTPGQITGLILGSQMRQLQFGAHITF